MSKPLFIFYLNKKFANSEINHKALISKTIYKNKLELHIEANDQKLAHETMEKISLQLGAHVYADKERTYLVGIGK